MTEIEGRAIAAGRALLGLEQSELADAAKISASTLSNVERAVVDSRKETVKSIRRALKKLGVTLHIDHTNGRVVIASNFEVEET